MTKNEYLSKRQEMLNTLQKMISDGAAEADYQAQKDRINALDEQWQQICDRQAQADLFNDKTSGFVPPWAAGEGVTFSGIGSNYQTGRANEDPVFLSDHRTMTDFARENNADAAGILSQPEALGDLVRGVVTGKWQNRELQNAVTTSGTSVLIPQVLSAQVIDLARDVSLFGQAKVPTVPMLTNNLTISRIKTDPVFKFKEEGAAADESSFELDSVELKSKTIYGYCYVTFEAIESSRNLDAVVRRTFAAAVAQGIDQAMLYGQHNGSSYDEFAPAGIMNDADILSVESSACNYDAFVRAAGAIRKKNGIPSVVAINAAVDEVLALQKNLRGDYLEPPKQFSELQKIITNQLKDVEGVGSDALVFDPSAMLIGLQNSLRIKVIEGSDEAIKKGLVAFQLYSMLDCQVVRPSAICKITGIGTSTADPEGSEG